MLLGALVDAGLPLQRLREELAQLPISGYSIQARTGQRGVVTGTHITVEMGVQDKVTHSIQEFLGMVDASPLSLPVKEKARRVLECLEAAEARVHGGGHRLHELGEMDTLIDVVGVVSGLELLGIERLYSSPLPCGWGVISSQHGSLPVPAPATLEIMLMAKAPVIPPHGPYLKAGELVTPTGAALITTLASFDAPTLAVERIGYGLGTRDMAELPNVLALWLGETQGSDALAQVSLLETNIDDMSAEILGHVQEELMRHGALDVWFTPIQMKKNRPAVTLSALCRPALESSLIKVILEESSTLGVRVHPLKRYEAEREVVVVDTSLGKARVKVKRVEGRTLGLSAEFEDCKEIAQREHLPLQEVYRRVERDARASLGMD
ncbi:MAG: hypothetical protein HW388_590 [Dehalococcoidia bacterium]|nr:hypothetical protein [Dehalococcoidia bacterium]